MTKKSRYAVKEVTLDLSDSMRKIVRTAFPKANRVIDRFHIQKLACDAVQELRIKHRWDAIQQANEEMEEAKQKNEDYVLYRYSNGDTRRELLIRSRYLLFKSADKWTERQKQRAAILFEEYPDIKKAYGLCHSLRMIFSKNTIKDAARLAMARWYNKVEEAGMHSFNIIAATFYEHLAFSCNCFSKYFLRPPMNNRHEQLILYELKHLNGDGNLLNAQRNLVVSQVYHVQNRWNGCFLPF